MKIEIGEIITLEDNKEYICLKRTRLNEKEYLYLISNFKPVEIRFAEEVIAGEEVYIKIVDDKDLKIQLLELFDN